MKDRRFSKVPCREEAPKVIHAWPEYSSGNPPRKGIYLCYIDVDKDEYAVPILLVWVGRYWVDEDGGNFREYVYGWIGPVPAMRFADSEEPEPRIRLIKPSPP